MFFTEVFIITKMHRAIFLDRDGTIIKDNGHIRSEKEVEFYDYTFDCLQQLQKYFLLFIITNQPGISKKFINKNDVEKVHSYIFKKMKDNGIEITEIYFCPHSKEDECLCRKPNPFFINKAEEKYLIDIRNSYVIGDHPSDVKLALKVDANGIYLLTGHGRKHYHELDDSIRHRIRICSNLKTATRTILKSAFCLNLPIDEKACQK